MRGGPPGCGADSGGQGGAGQHVTHHDVRPARQGGGAGPRLPQRGFRGGWAQRGTARTRGPPPCGFLFVSWQCMCACSMCVCIPAPNALPLRSLAPPPGFCPVTTTPQVAPQPVGPTRPGTMSWGWGRHLPGSLWALWCRSPLPPPIPKRYIANLGSGMNPDMDPEHAIASAGLRCTLWPSSTKKTLNFPLPQTKTSVIQLCVCITYINTSYILMNI